ncbi:transporter substrate-binding domain-containing protein [Chromobacterium vaccinii]|uniref:Transporter substrate-binding domain-containing protein n=1 Tax=Chromobacterium piscinae TaxID=686831 RepID=A0ABV0H5C2_9NEIS|nr:transporter substrate-binding domain-containing protein [Chromobacterium piscinae]MBX9349347.1 transporter substrate-binding domain-containing protein [Chromobacterium vaccinii]MCD4504605.1 transporter substrate-binding domain-containing protein [Chromobacterium piscinae]NHQ82316.1 transporter substrate-binding domain-containing protein [Chromobacterium vaccinii]
MRLRLQLGALLAAILLFPMPGRADGLAQVRIYTDDDPPYVMVGSGGQVMGGTTVEKVTRVMRKLGLPFSALQAAPWARAYQEAKSRPYAMVFPIARTREREKYLDFTFKILDTDIYFYRLAARNDIQPRTLDEARKYRVCVVLNDYRHEFLTEQGFSKLEVSSDSTLNVRKLAAGRCDLLPSTESGIAGKLKALGLDRALVARGIRLDKLDSGLYAAFNKDTPPEVIARFRAAAAELP